MAKITKKAVDALQAPLPGQRPLFLWDDELRGFGVKALPSGTKRFILKYRTDGGGRAAKQRWLTVGAFGAITVEQAKGLARQALAEIARGGDPQASKEAQRVAPTLDDIWLRFETEHLPQRKPLTRRDYTALWINLIKPKFGKVKVEALQSTEVDRFHKGLRSTPYQANRMLALLSKLMSTAEAWGLRPQSTNPCKHIARFEEQARTRYLSPQELERLGSSIVALTSDGTLSPTAGNAIKLLLFTGARLNELLTAQWAWIDISKKVLDIPDSKTGAKTIYLSAAALKVIKRQKKISGTSIYLFSSPRLQDKPLNNLRKSWIRVCKKAKFENVRLHDLRHTAASVAAGQGVSLPIIGRLLGHSQAQTTQRYAHVDAHPALAAANQIGAHVSDAFTRAGKLTKRQKLRTKPNVP